MGAVWMITWVELRRRLGSLAMIGLLVALVAAVVLTALVGARRTATSVDRFRDRLEASDVSYQSDGPERAEAMLAAIRDVDGVETASLRVLVNVFPEEGAATDLAVMSDPDGIYGAALDQALVLEGRLPAPDAPDEILLNELAARVSGLGVGDRLEASTWSTQDLEDLFDSPDFPGFNGPQVELEVVGVGRVPEELTGDVRRTSPFALASPAFLQAHPDIGAWPPAVVVRMKPGADPASVTGAVAGVRDLTDTAAGPAAFFPDGTTAAEVYLDTAQNTTDTLALALVVVALGSLAAGGFAVVQAVQRALAGSACPPARLAPLGLPRNRIAAAQTAPVVLAGTVGIVVGAVAAVLASPLLPLGLARRAEVDPGIWFEPLIIVAGASGLAVLLAAVAFLVAHRGSDADQRTRRRRSSALTRVAERLGAGPTVAAGLRLASDRGRGSGAVPLRSSRAGLAVAVTGLVVAGVIGASYSDLERTPADWGWAWSTMPDYFGDGDIQALEARMLEDDRVAAVGRLDVDTVVVDEKGVTSYSLDALRGPMSLTSVDGRLPSGVGEIALGRETSDELDASIGDTLVATRSGGEGTVTLTVVGTVVLPPADEYSSDVGAALTPDGLAAAGSGDLLSSLVLSYPEGVDVSRLEAALSEDYGLEFDLFTQANPPGPVRNLVAAVDIATWLAAFFVAIALVGLLHALVVATRRRRVDLSVLRTLGGRPGQVRSSVMIAAVTLALTGALIGIPAGVVIGRSLWRVLVDESGAVAGPATPWPLLVVVAPAACLLAVMVAWMPARSAVRARPAQGLRVE